jgi:hypothetical protein
VVEHLPSKIEALSSNPSTAKKTLKTKKPKPKKKKPKYKLKKLLKRKIT